MSNISKRNDWNAIDEIATPIMDERTPAQTGEAKPVQPCEHRMREANSHGEWCRTCGEVLRGVKQPTIEQPKAKIKRYRVMVIEPLKEVQAYREKLFKEVFENVQVKIGLEQQGHIPTVEKMLEDGMSWDEIGKAIGWHGPTANQWYIAHLRAQAEKDKADGFAMSAEIEMFKERAEVAEHRIVKLEEALRRIAEHLDPDSTDDDQYRADDPEGAMDTAFSVARAALTPSTEREEKE